MKKLSLVLLLIVGLVLIGALVWFYQYQPTTPPDLTNTAPTWTTSIDNELVIVQLDQTVTAGYSFDLEPFGRLTFQALDETQTIGNQQLRLVSVTRTSAQVLVSTIGDE